MTNGLSSGIIKETEESANIINCTNKGNINGVGNAGGIVGTNRGRIENCMSSAKIQGEYLVGGIAGINETDSSIITDCYNTGTVTSTGATTMDGSSETQALTEGIAGHNYGTVTKCINNGTVKATYRTVGGITGRNLRSNIILL